MNFSNNNKNKITFGITSHKLGHGSKSCVYEAYDLNNKDNRYAAKIIEKNDIDNFSEFENVLQEMKINEILSKDPHQNICKVQATSEDTNNFYLFFELIKGNDFCVLIDKFYQQARQGLPESEARYFMKQLVNAVEHIHDKGIFHRDIKLENMVLDSKTNALKLLDFGLSGFIHDTYDHIKKSKKPKKKLHQKFCGSPQYVAPEIAQKKSYHGEPIDIWTMGIVLYCFLQGHFPFYIEDHETQNDLFQKIIENEVKFVLPISKNAKKLIRKMLHKNPKKRVTLSQIKKSKWMNTTFKSFC